MLKIQAGKKVPYYPSSEAKDTPEKEQQKELMEGTTGVPINDFVAFNDWLGNEFHPKKGMDTPPFSYQVKMRNLLREHRKLIVNKFTGAGGTPYGFRIFLEMCLADRMQLKQIAIVTGLSESFSRELVEERLKPIIEYRHPDLIKRNIQGRLELTTGHYFKTYPSKRVKKIRGQKDLLGIFVDEDSFFDEGDQIELEFSIERYKLKTNPYILRVSTPNGNTGLYYRNFIDAQKRLNDYYPFIINYREGISNGLFTLKEIEDELAKKGKLRMFAQEYDNQFLSPLGSIMIPVTDDQMTLEEEIL